MNDEFWNKKYLESINFLKHELPKLNPVIVGFNANIDKIKYLNRKFLKIIPINNDKENEINDLGDLGRGLNESIKSGRANEWEVTNEEVYEKIRSFKYNEKRVGGQGAIVSDLLSKIGLRNILLTPQLSKKLSKYIPSKNTVIPLVRNGNLAFENPKKSYNKNVITKVNCIFEFKKGFMNSPRANRFIVSHRPKGLDPVLSDELEEHIPELVSGSTKAFLSGYATVHKDDAKQIFSKSKKQISKMKKHNSKLRIHVEFTNIEEEWLRNMIIKNVISQVHSLGMNEVETCLLLNSLGEKKLAKEIADSDYDITNHYKGVLKIKKKLKLKRIHSHNFGYFMCIFDKDYSTPEKVLNAHIHASNIAEAKATLGTIKNIKDINKIANSTILTDVDMWKKMGFENGIKEDGNYFSTINPMRKTKKIKSTVGLGDTISSTSFILDEL